MSQGLIIFKVDGELQVRFTLKKNAAEARKELARFLGERAEMVEFYCFEDAAALEDIKALLGYDYIRKSLERLLLEVGKVFQKIEQEKHARETNLWIFSDVGEGH